MGLVDPHAKPLSPFFGQVIASAPTFPKAIQKMQRALAEFQVWNGEDYIIPGR